MPAHLENVIQWFFYDNFAKLAVTNIETHTVGGNYQAPYKYIYISYKKAIKAQIRACTTHLVIHVHKLKLGHAPLTWLYL